MTPDAELQIFAVKRGMIEKRMDVSFFQLMQKDISIFNMVTLGELCCEEPNYGSSQSAVKKEHYQQPNYIRITDFSDVGIEKNHEFVSVEKYSSKDVLKDKDLLFARTGASVGKTYIHNEKIGFSVFAGYCIRFRLNQEKVLPEYVWAYTKTKRFSSWIQQTQRKSGQPNINKEEYKSILIPLPSIRVQQEMVTKFIIALENRSKKLQQAEDLLAGMDEFITNHIGLAKSDFSKHRMCWGIKRKDLNPRRLDALFYMPSSCDKFNSHHECRLADIAILNSNSKKNIMFSENVPYVGLPECSSNGIISIEKKKYKEVSGRNIAIPGDILFARIEPSIFNKKYVWTDNLHGHEYVFLSTEFYTIRAIDFSLQKFIYAMLFYPAVYEQFFGKTVGSTGRRRLDKRSLEDVIIPMPDIEICKAIGEEFFRRQKMAEELKLSAEKEWQEAKEQFEKEVLGE